jgi:hypothetical protein
VLAIATVAPAAVAQKRITVEGGKQDITCPFGQRHVCRKLIEDAATRYCNGLNYKSGWPARMTQLGEVWTLIAVTCE